jgi:molecular chaperone DnaJ
MMATRDLYEKDYYAVLGLSKSADAATIKKTYRNLARELHPDKTKGDKKLEDRFKEVSEAYEILSDDKKRAEYDEARSLYESGAFRQQGFGGGGFTGDFNDLFSSGGDIFSTIFGGRRAPRRGSDIQTEVRISFRESIFGKEVSLKLSSQANTPASITTRIPAGVTDGAKIRIKGRGAPGEAGPGDLYIIVHVTPHPVFGRKGEHLTITLPITFAEAALGADVPVPTIDGDEVRLRITPGSQNGKTLRVKGRGVKKGVNVGDLLVTLEVQVPQRLEASAQNALEKFAEVTKDYDPRAEWKGQAKG